MDALNRLHELAGQRRDGMVGERPLERGEGSGPTGQAKLEQRLFEELQRVARVIEADGLPLLRVFSVVQDLLMVLNEQLEPLEISRPLPDAAELLARSAELYRTRNAVYGNNYRDIGPVLAGFFPNGITLKTPVDFIRFHLFMLIHVKLTRYTNQWTNGHSDSLLDTSVYSAMLERIDSEMRAGLGAFPREGRDV